MWGIAPSEFWRMTVGEWHLVADFHTEQAQADKGSGRRPLTEDEKAELYSLIDPEATWH